MRVSAGTSSNCSSRPRERYFAVISICPTRRKGSQCDVQLWVRLRRHSQRHRIRCVMKGVMVVQSSGFRLRCFSRTGSHSRHCTPGIALLVLHKSPNGALLVCECTSRKELVKPTPDDYRKESFITCNFQGRFFSSAAQHWATLLSLKPGLYSQLLFCTEAHAGVCCKFDVLLVAWFSTWLNRIESKRSLEMSTLACEFLYPLKKMLLCTVWNAVFSCLQYKVLFASRESTFPFALS